MAWLMFKQSNNYQPRGKKCDGFINKAKPQINLSWGMEQFQQQDKKNINNFVNKGVDKDRDRQQIQIEIEKYHERQRQRQKQRRKYNDKQKYNNKKQVNNTYDQQVLKSYRIKDKDKQSNLHAGVYQKKSDQEQLQKILKSYDTKKIGSKIASMRIMQPVQAYTSERIHKRQDTQTSSQQIRNLQSSLIPITELQSPNYNRRDTIGSILSPQKQYSYKNLGQSRMSRRSSTGNKKNQSKVVFGDGIYNGFFNRQQKSKQFHQRLQQMYQYQEKKKNRVISQIVI